MMIKAFDRQEDDSSSCMRKVQGSIAANSGRQQKVSNLQINIFRTSRGLTANDQCTKTQCKPILLQTHENQASLHQEVDLRWMVQASKDFDEDEHCRYGDKNITC